MAADARFLNFLCLLFILIIRASQRLLLHRGDSQKAEHLKVIKNKVLNPSRMHDIQSVGHTWLHSDKTLSSSNSCSRIVTLVGDKKTLPMAFKSFQCFPILGELLTRAEWDLLFVFRALILKEKSFLRFEFFFLKINKKLRCNFFCSRFPSL